MARPRTPLMTPERRERLAAMRVLGHSQRSDAVEIARDIQRREGPLAALAWLVGVFGPTDDQVYRFVCSARATFPPSPFAHIAEAMGMPGDEVKLSLRWRRWLKAMEQLNEAERAPGPG